jgi:hypothetical protein
VCIFIPFTIHGILLKASMITHSPIVHGMSTCLQALEHLSERHDDVDFFFHLHQAALGLTHQIMFQDSQRNQCNFDSGVNLQTSLSSSRDSEVIPPLARTEAYSQVLKLHNRVLIEGNFDLVKKGSS